ncbi:hypothetical protein HMPREF9688_02557 [Klebsiella oxytoca 10-5244]|nr:hypothetical protein HMPREF9688_02557 [Klebsiella oxytoca 10-5244]
MRWLPSLLLILSIELLSVLIIMYSPGPDYFNASCRAHMDYRGITQGEGFDFEGDISFFFNNDRTGRYYISGIINDNERSYPISRFVTFTYQNNGKKVYTFRRVNVEKSVHDNLSDMTQGKSKRMLPLTQKISFNIGVNKNYIIFSNAVSPLFICIRS